MDSPSLRPSIVGVELRIGWPMHVGVVLLGRDIVWRAPVARTHADEAAADADEAFEAVRAKQAPLRRCQDCRLDLGSSIDALASCPRFGQDRRGVESRCDKFEPRR